MYVLILAPSMSASTISTVPLYWCFNISVAASKTLSLSQKEGVALVLTPHLFEPGHKPECHLLLLLKAVTYLNSFLTKNRCSSRFWIILCNSVRYPSLISISSGVLSVAIGGNDYQTPLMSGINIKTINSTSILGSGDITIIGSTGSGDVVGQPTSIDSEITNILIFDKLID